MKATGIVRRIDELGRIVIPKEIRKNLRIKSGENLEIYTENDVILLKKNSPLEKIGIQLDSYLESLQKVIKKNVIVTDRNKVISTFGNKKQKYMDKTLSNYTESLMERRDSFIERQKKKVNFFEQLEEECFYSFTTILYNGDILGSLIIISEDVPVSEEEEKIAIILSKIFEKYFVE